MDAQPVDGPISSEPLPEQGEIAGDARVMLGAGAAPREAMPMLPIVFDDLCSRLARALSDLFGQDTAVTVEALRSRRFGDVIDDVLLPSQFVPFLAEGWGGRALLVTDPPLAILTLERLLGAGQGARSQALGRPYSRIETAILTRVADAVLGSAQAAFSELAPVILRREGVEADPRLLTVALRSDTVFSAELRIALGEWSGGIGLVLPYASLGPARTALRSPFMGKNTGGDDPWSAHLATETWQATLEAEAVLHETRLPLRQLLHLSVGDTLMFDVTPDDLVEIRCGGVAVTRGRMGRVDGRIAVQVVEPVTRFRAPSESPPR
jgi:flagellar motor switch protein FliM